jgi:lipopolysaccharide transport system ATP-binding protein
MSSDTAVLIEGLSKSYQIYDQPRDRLAQMVVPRLQRAVGLAGRQYYRDFWAVRDVSLQVRKGETVGIIGRNGSGKSTLLQMVAGTLAPSSGSIDVRGRVAALLELGSGFSPEFTGRENVHTNATVLGLSASEIEARMDTIAAFADIGEFLDQPVKTYSSGMLVRLAFAVQAQVDPDVLIVDEALAVGDAKFQAKCFERLRQLKGKGTSILLVTHSTEQIVTHCDRAVLLEGGRAQMIGAPRDVVNRYLDLLFGRDRLSESVPPPTVANLERITPPDRVSRLSLTSDAFATRHGYNPHEYRWGDGAATILDFSMEANGVADPATIAVGDRVQIDVAVRFERPLVSPIIGATLKSKDGITIFGTNSEMLATPSLWKAGNPGEVLVVRLGFTCRLGAGDYFLSIGVATREADAVIPRDRRYDAIHLQVVPDARFFGLADLALSMDVMSRSQNA